MSAKRDRRKAEEKDDQKRVVVELGGKSVTVISARDGVQHFAFACDDHTAEEMLDCDICLLALKDVRELALLRSVAPPDPKAWRVWCESWAEALKGAAA